jgi:hypothetical protein
MENASDFRTAFSFRHPLRGTLECCPYLTVCHKILVLKGSPHPPSVIKMAPFPQTFL